MSIDSLLDTLDGERRCYHVSFPGEGERIEARLLLPAGAKDCRAVLLNQGLAPAPGQDIANTLSRFVTEPDLAMLIPKYLGHKHDHLIPEDAEHVVQAFRFLQGVAEVDAARVSMIGFSYGGMLSLLGAEDDRMASDVRAVVSVSGPTDMEDLILYALTARGADRRIGRLLRDSLLQSASEKVRRLRASSQDSPELYKDYFLVSELLQKKDAYSIIRLIDELSEDAHEQLRLFSPALRADRINCPVMLVHGAGDTIIPYRQSQIMHGALLAEGKQSELVSLPGIGHIVYASSPREALTYLRNDGRALFGRIREFLAR